MGQTLNNTHEQASEALEIDRQNLDGKGVLTQGLEHVLAILATKVACNEISHVFFIGVNGTNAAEKSESYR